MACGIRQADSREDKDCSHMLAYSCNPNRCCDLLNGQISVGMFLSWRRRWETVWAAWCQCLSSSPLTLHLAYPRGPPSVNWSAFDPTSSFLRHAYRHRTAQAQRLPHKQLRARPHEHVLRGAHHHHARGLHRQNPRSLEHLAYLISCFVEWRGSGGG
jgi:hypothetical protein